MTEQSLDAQQQTSTLRKGSLWERTRLRFKNAPTYLVLGAWSIFTAFTMVWVVMASLKTNREVFREPWNIPVEIQVDESGLNIKTNFQFQNYQKAWDASKLGTNFKNSVIIVGISVVIILLVSAPAAYILSRAKFRGRNLLTMTYIAGIGVPYPLLFIPLFAMLAGIGLVNTISGLILVYVSLSIPFTVYILTGFFATLPKELEDSAVIDGCNDFQVFRHVMLPLASPGMLTAAIFNFIGLWNEFQLALIFIQDPDQRTLSLGLYAMKNAMTYTGDWAGLFAGVVLVMVPTILLFIILSERMISGITMGSVK